MNFTLVTSYIYNIVAINFILQYNNSTIDCINLKYNCVRHIEVPCYWSCTSLLSQIQARFQLEVLVPYIVERASLCVWQTNKTQLTSMAVGIRRPSYSEIRRRCQYCWDNQLTEPIHSMSTQVQQHVKHIVLPWTCSPVNPMIMTTNTLSLQYYTHFNLFKSSVYNSQNFFKWLPNSRGLSSYSNIFTGATVNIIW